MGTYYQIVNYTKHERIFMDDVANIKHGAFEVWSLQGAILNIFLGFAWPSHGLNFGSFVGRWAGDQIEIQNDARHYEHPNDEEHWLDAGMLFLANLDQANFTPQFMKIIDLPWNEEHHPGDCDGPPMGHRRADHSGRDGVREDKMAVGGYAGP